MCNCKRVQIVTLKPSIGQFKVLLAQLNKYDRPVCMRITTYWMRYLVHLAYFMLSAIDKIESMGKYWSSRNESRPHVSPVRVLPTAI